MLDSLRIDVTTTLSRVRPVTEEEQKQMALELAQQQRAMMEAAQAGASPAAPSSEPTTVAQGEPRAGFDENDPSTWGNPGRNEPCPCGSGKKFKHCHGRLA